MLRHLELLNVFLALRFRQPGYPTCLADNGYLVQAIGSTIQLMDGTKVVPDVIASREQPGLTLLVEVKGGKELDGDQLARMLRLGVQDIRDLAHLPVRDAASHRIQVVYLCNEAVRSEFAETIGSRDVTVVGFDGARFRFSGTVLADQDLARCLGNAEALPGSIPLAIIPFDGDSPDEEVALAVIPHVVQALVHGTGTLSSEHVVGQTHYLVHDAMRSTGSGSELAGVVNRVKSVLRRLALAELSDWIEPVPKQPLFRLKRALSHEPAARTRELQRLRSASEQYLEGLGSHRGVQLELVYPEGEVLPRGRDDGDAN